MSQCVRHQALIVLATALVMFTNLGAPRLWDDDEPRNATCAREMLERGDWIVPTFNDELRPDKPVLLYWFMMLAYQVFGASEFAARFWSAIFATGTVLCTYHLGRMLFRPQVGLWAALALATCIMFDIAGRAATPDSTLIFLTTLALTLFVRGVARQAHSRPWGTCDATDSATRRRQCLPNRWTDYALIYAAMGAAVLAKGPVGVMLPVGVFTLYTFFISQPVRSAGAETGNWREVVHAAISGLHDALVPRHSIPGIRALRPLMAVAIVAAIALPWYIMVGIRTDGEWLAGFLGKHNVGRFINSMEGHRGPIWYYILASMAGMLPWSIFLPLSVWQIGARIYQRHPWRAAYVFIACWIGAYFVFFSLAGTKLPSYVLPAYPALALAVAAFLDSWVTKVEQVRLIWMRLAFVSLATLGIATAVGLALAAPKLLPGDGMLGLVGVVLVVGGIAGLWFIYKAEFGRAVSAMALTAVAFSVALWGYAAPIASRHQNAPQIVQLVRRLSSEQDGQLATYAFHPPSLVYYNQKRVEPLREIQDVRRFFETAGNRYLVTLAEEFEAIKDSLPADLVVIERQQRFLNDEEVLIIGRSVQTARKTTEDGTN